MQRVFFSRQVMSFFAAQYLSLLADTFVFLISAQFRTLAIFLTFSITEKLR